MVFDVIVVGNFFQYQAKDVFEGIFFIRIHIATDSLVFLIQDPFETGICFSCFVHRKRYGSHFQVDRELIGFFFSVSSIFELEEVVVFPL